MHIEMKVISFELEQTVNTLVTSTLIAIELTLVMHT